MQKEAYDGTGNWYQNIKNKDIQELYQILDQGVYVQLVKAKTDPAFAKSMYGNYAVQKEFMSLEQTAQKVLDNVRYKDMASAQSTMQRLVSGFQGLCYKINCQTSQLFNSVRQNIDNARIMLQNISF